MKKITKLLFAATFLTMMGTISVYATDEEMVEPSVEQVKTDTIAPVFDPSIQTRYVLKKSEEEEQFNPDEVIKDLIATDDVDGTNVKIELYDHNVDLTRDGVYQVLYTATDKAGNQGVLVVEVLVDGIAPIFEDGIETTYYMNKAKVITDSKHNVVESLPKTLVAKDSAGAFCGIGVYITTDVDGNIIIVDTIKDTPAEESLKANDIIIGVDGEDIRGKTADYAASVIKGEDGKPVELLILRDGEEITVTIIRDLIKVYEEEEKLAEPDVDITAIEFQANGKIEITYTATDEAGNISTFVITVIEEPEEDVIVEDKKEIKDEELETVTTGEKPSKELEELSDVKENEEEKDSTDKKDTNLDETDKTNTNTEETEKDNKDDNSIDNKIEE